MKVSGKGGIAILVFLVALPVLVDAILSQIIRERDLPHFGMTSFLLFGYLKLLPLYILYLGIAFYHFAFNKTV